VLDHELVGDHARHARGNAVRLHRLAELLGHVGIQLCSGRRCALYGTT
jgi:hypothetical protein